MIGGDILFDDCKYNLNSMNYNTLLYTDKGSFVGVSMFSAIMVLFNCGTSDDSLYMSYAFQVGVIESLVLCVSALLLTQCGLHLFITTWSYNSENSYVSIWKECFGNKTRFIPRILLLLAFISLSAISTGDFLDQYNDLISYVDANHSTIFSSKYFSKFVLTFIFVFPSLFHNRFSSMKYASGVANLLLLISILCELWLFIKSTKENGFDPQKEIVYWSGDFKQAVYCMDVFNSLFFIAPFAAIISREIKEATRNKICKLTWYTSIASLFINLAGGYLGYFTFFSNQEDDSVFLNFEDQKQIPIIIGKLALLIKTILANNNYIYINAISLSDVVFPYSEEQKVGRISSGVVVWFLTIFITFKGTKLLGLFDLFGSFSFVILAFILPSVYYLVIYKFKRPITSIIAILELFICAVVSGALLYYKVVDFAGEYSGTSIF